MSTSAVLAQIFAPFFKILALCGSLAGILLGACLLLRTERTLARMREMNRWVSSRQVMKPLEVPRTFEQRVRGRRLWLGLLLAAAGAYALSVLVWSFEAGRLGAALGAPPGSPLAAIGIESLRWFLVAGSALCVAVGLMMALAPRALEGFEAWSNRWVSTRQALQGADTMYMPFDRLAERFPRACGFVILGLSLASAAASAVLLLAR